ncbi:MAG TPA: methyltransferase domain-containing protein [Anaerolineae bacterium]|nr:methyltransferase domain-containing protein [Anaerolineae bacterium]HQH37796.1 methyltransferase domain-containing protein [Anaerolineae bacterium]
MQPIPDWLSLWRELVEAHARGRAQAKVDEHPDVWRDRAHTYHETVQRRWAKPDSSRAFIAADLERHPGETVLDIGAGTGAWTAFLARVARHVTALDLSPAMLNVLRENVAAEGLTNVSIIAGGWPEVDVVPHDVVLCSHALYGVADFAAAVHKMTAVAQRRCYLLLRVVTPDGVMAQAAQHIWGQPYDSPNFQVGYNALLQLGIFANVLLEDTGLWKPWVNASLDEALADVKRRFDLVNDPTHDVFLRDLLAQHLTEVNGQWVWPSGTRSALVYWDVEKAHHEP